MDASREFTSPMPVCEVCWIKDHAAWEPESIDGNGNILMRLKSVDVPQKLNTGSVESCSVCNGITVSGIFELRDPQVVMYPATGPAGFRHTLTPLEDGEEEEL
jgi:hypothetical protein